MLTTILVIKITNLKTDHSQPPHTPIYLRPKFVLPVLTYTKLRDAGDPSV